MLRIKKENKIKSHFTVRRFIFILHNILLTLNHLLVKNLHTFKIRQIC